MQQIVNAIAPAAPAPATAAPQQSSQATPSSGPVLLAPANPQLLVNEQTAMPALLQSLQGAKQSIDVSMFSWFPNGSGEQVAQVLEARARAGVEVNVLVDDTGSLQIPLAPQSKLFQQMAAAGVHVLHNKSDNLCSGDSVDHRKLYVIDGAQAYIGGMNLGQTYDAWHDAMASFGGDSVVSAGQQFLSRWTQQGGTVSTLQTQLYHPDTPQAGDPAAQVIANQPKGDEQITQAYLSNIQSARQRVWVESPVISSQQMASALEDAAKRGVDVRLMITGKDSDHGVPGLSLISRTYYSQLMAAGVKVYEQQDMSHSKILLTDNTADVGSFNLTNRSASHDDEIALQVTAQPFVDQVDKMLQTDMTGGRQVTSADLSSFGSRVLTGINKIFHVQY